MREPLPKWVQQFPQTDVSSMLNVVLEGKLKENVMSGRTQASYSAFIPYDDPVRREAYERALEILRGRQGLSRDSDVAAVRSYDGPVIIGNRDTVQPR